MAYNKLLQSGRLKQEITPLHTLIQIILKADPISTEAIKYTLKSIFCEPEERIKKQLTILLKILNRICAGCTQPKYIHIAAM